MSGQSPIFLPEVFADIATGIEAIQRGSIASIAKAGGTSDQISHASAVLGDFALWARAQEIRARLHSQGVVPWAVRRLTLVSG
jgi:hypothetical protein